MPDAINWISAILASEEGAGIGLQTAEKFTEKAFYNFGQIIKADRQKANAFVSILERLVTLGSAKAYMLREELIYYK